MNRKKRNPSGLDPMLLLLLAGGYVLYTRPDIANQVKAQVDSVVAQVNNAITGTSPSAGDSSTALAANPVERTPEQIAAALGTTVYRVRTAMAQTGKNAWEITLADLEGIPEVPSVVYVGPSGQTSATPQTGYVASNPNPSGQPATWNNPTGGSGTWGGMTDQQIRDSFTATYGSEEAGAAAWQAQHDAEVAANGY